MRKMDLFERTLLKNAERLDDDVFAKKVYSALCNMRWKSKKDPSYIYSCSWRYAGGLIATLRCKGEDYLDFYCSGHEGWVDPEVLKFFDELGFEPLQYETDKRQTFIEEIKYEKPVQKLSKSFLKRK